MRCLKIICFVNIPVLCFLLIFSGCSGDEITTPGIEEERPEIIDILPHNPSTGDELKIILNCEAAEIGHNGHIYFDDNWSYTDSAKADTIYTFMPFIKNKSTVAVKLEIHYNGEQLNITKETAITNSCPSGLCVIRNDEGVITEEDIVPVGMGSSDKSKVFVNQDTTTISLFAIIADESNQTITMKFLNTTGYLPGFVNCTRIKNESDGASPSVTTYDTLKAGLLKIEDWNNNGVYSGKIYAGPEPFESTTYFPPRIVFWVKSD